MPKDRRQGIRSQTKPVQAPSQGELASTLTQLRGLQRRAGRRGRVDEMQVPTRFIELAEEMAAFEAMSDEIYASIETLSEHRSEFEAMMGNDVEASGRARRLFSEERFARWRFTAEDMYRTFEAVGYPEGRIEAQKNHEITEAALLHLVSREQRGRLAWQLFMLLPQYVDAGQYLDAWLIQYSAFLMLDEPELSNPFLFIMYHLGYEEWATQIEDQRRAAIREIGFDPDELRTSDPSLEELEARVQAALEDPEKRARMEAAQERYAMLASQAEAELWEWQRNAMRLLEREDAARLHLSDEEMQPWIPMLEERLGPLSVEVEQALAEGRAEDQGITDAVSQEMWDISKEMTAEIFTPERVAQLIEELQAYRRDLEAAQERQAAIFVHGALISLKGDLDQGEEPLLIAICFASLRSLLIGFAEGMGTETE